MFTLFSSRRSPLLAVASLACCGTSAIAQRQLWYVAGDYHQEIFGTSVAQLGDVNGDGVPDWAVGVGVNGGRPRIRICSGSANRQLLEIEVIDGWNSALPMASAGDRNGDGCDVVLIGINPFVAQVYSGRDGSLLQSYEVLTSDLSSFALANLGDVDGDRVPDYLFAIPGYTGPTSLGPGSVDLVSGATGALIHQWVNDRVGTVAFGHVASSAGDFDGDSITDVVLLEENYYIVGQDLRIRVISSASGATLMDKKLPLQGNLWTSTLSAMSIDDLDGDSRRDLIVCFNDSATVPHGAAVAFGSSNSSELFRLDATDWAFGFDCCEAGDLDQDGVPDFAIRIPDWTGTGGKIIVYSGSDQSTLHTITYDKGATGRHGLDRGIDFDGDGYTELLIGIPDYRPTPGGGKAEVRSLATGAPLFERFFDGSPRETLSGSACFFDDLDGDGILDVLMGLSPTNRAIDADEIVALSGADGHELRRFKAGTQDFGGTLIAVPDINGDGVSEFSVASADFWGPGSIEVRSGSDGSLLQAFSDARTGSGFGQAMAAAAQPSGVIEMMVGVPYSDTNSADAGEVLIFNVAKGTQVGSKLGSYASERYGSRLAFVGDVNKDGIGDWAVAAPWNDIVATDAGRVAIINGKTYSQIRHFLGATADDEFGHSISAIRDLDGDVVSELLVGAPLAGAIWEGELRIYSLKNGTLIRTITGWAFHGHLGWDSSTVEDANGDGFDDIIAYNDAGRVDLWSGSTGSILRTLNGSYYDSGRLFTAPAWLASAGSHRAAGPLLGAYRVPQWDTDGGELWVLELDDLYLQLTLDTAPKNSRATADTRGGPPGNPVLLVLESANGVPINLTLAVSFLDNEGAFSIGERVPPGLSGTAWTLRSYAIGFSGKVVDSQPETVTFE